MSAAPSSLSASLDIPAVPVVEPSHPYPPSNLCMRCGACCACFRVAFPRQEGSDMPNGVVPLAFTVARGLRQLVMKGTEGRNPRCIALKGVVGASVYCMLHDRRPSSCRNFIGAWEANMTNPRCNSARALFGLPPFEPF